MITPPKIYVANLAWSVSNADLMALFNTIGKVRDAFVVVANGRSRGFGFVEMVDPALTRTAIHRLDGHPFQGRRLFLTVANPEDR
jgi:RNA recognition motif-containing protein